MTLGRITFMEAVIRPFSWVNSSGRMMNLRTDSARETPSLARSTHCCTSARTAAFLAASSRDMFSSSPLAASHGRNDFSSNVTRAEMNGRLSPSTNAWETNSQRWMTSSIGPGETFLPPAVMIRSFLRPVMYRNPSLSMRPRSPVAYQPSSVNDSSVASSFL